MKKIISSFLVLITIFTQFGLLPASANTLFSTRASKDKITNETRYSYINIDWWNLYNDENLTHYIKRAFENNHDLKMSTILTQEYYQAMRLQFSQELPKAGVGFAPIDYKLPYTTNYDWRFILPVAVNYEVDFFLKNHDKTKSAKKLYETSLQDERSAYIMVASGVATVYFNIVKLDELIEIQNKIVKDRKLVYNLMQNKYEKGLISQSDTILAEKAYTQSEIELSDLKKEQIKLLNQLSIMIGESPENISELTRNSVEEIKFSGKIPQSISSEIIENRPDYIRAYKELEKAGIDVRIAKKEFLPTFDIAGLALFNAGNFGSTLTTVNSLIAFGGGIIQPIFLGGARVANLKLKKSSYERILENYKKTNLVAMQEINDSLVTIKQDDEKYQKLLSQYELSQKEYYYNLKRYNKGIISKLDLTQSEEVVFTMKKLITIQKMDNYVNYIGLYKSTGAKL